MKRPELIHDYTVGSITIAAGEMSGTTMLMVTDDDMPDAGTGTNMDESLVLVGSVDGMEVGTLEFIIWDAAVPALPIIAQLLLAAFLAIGGYRRLPAAVARIGGCRRPVRR